MLIIQALLTFTTLWKHTAPLRDLGITSREKGILFASHNDSCCVCASSTFSNCTSFSINFIFWYNRPCYTTAVLFHCCQSNIRGYRLKIKNWMALFCLDAEIILMFLPGATIKKYTIRWNTKHCPTLNLMKLLSKAKKQNKTKNTSSDVWKQIQAAQHWSCVPLRIALKGLTEKRSCLGTAKIKIRFLVHFPQFHSILTAAHCF